MVERLFKLAGLGPTELPPLLLLLLFELAPVTLPLEDQKPLLVAEAR